MLYNETVDEGTRLMIQTLMRDPVLNNFYLVGGTALSLQLGHRISEDIDMFSHTKFDKKLLMEHLQAKYDPNYMQMMKHGVACFPGKEKIDFFYYPAPLIKPVKLIEGIRMLSIEDIAAMKINAIAFQQERVKDFADIYAILEKKSLSELMGVYAKKYTDLDAQSDAAKLADTTKVDLREIKMMDKGISWDQITERLKLAVLKPDKIFNQPKQSLLQKKVRKPRKGKGL